MRRLVTLLSLSLLAHCGGQGTDAKTTPAPSAGSPMTPPSSSRDEAPSPALDPGDAGTEPVSDAASPLDGGAPGAAPFMVGYNEAWFGSHYSSDLTSGYDDTLVATTLDGIVAAGGHVVRLWLFEGLEGVVLGASSPRITGLDAALLPNLEKVLLAARARKLAVYLTAFDGNAMPQDAGAVRDLYWNIVNDAYGEGTAYENTVLAPLLTTLGSYKDVVYAFDLMNEIEAPRIHGRILSVARAPRCSGGHRS